MSVISVITTVYGEKKMEKVNDYDNTVDESRGKSLEKALQIFYEKQGINRNNTLPRPDVDLRSGAIRAVFTIAFLICFYLFVSHIAGMLNLPGSAAAGINITVTCVLIMAFSKRMLIWGIHLYQKYAPDHIRESCVFEPSCSEYMLIALGKYGALKGTYKGIKRLCRCHYPNGGIDKP